MVSPKDGGVRQSKRSKQKTRPNAPLSVANFTWSFQSQRGYEKGKTGRGGSRFLPAFSGVRVTADPPPHQMCVKSRRYGSLNMFDNTREFTCARRRRRRRERWEARQNVKQELAYLKAAGAVFNHLQRLVFSFSRRSLAPERAETAILWVHGRKSNKIQRRGQV